MKSKLTTSSIIKSEFYVIAKLQNQTWEIYIYFKDRFHTKKTQYKTGYLSSAAAYQGVKLLSRLEKKQWQSFRPNRAGVASVNTMTNIFCGDTMMEVVDVVQPS